MLYKPRERQLRWLRDHVWTTSDTNIILKNVVGLSVSLTLDLFASSNFQLFFQPFSSSEQFIIVVVNCVHVRLLEHIGVVVVLVETGLLLALIWATTDLLICHRSSHHISFR